MSYNTADNYPLPYDFNGGETTQRTAEQAPRIKVIDHPVSKMEVGEVFYYGKVSDNSLRNAIMVLRKQGKVFETDRVNKTYTRIC
jgi:hypothetical protein